MMKMGTKVQVQPNVVCMDILKSNTDGNHILRGQ
jgi:hypothetical protein